MRMQRERKSATYIYRDHDVEIYIPVELDDVGTLNSIGIVVI